MASEISKKIAARFRPKNSLATMVKVSRGKGLMSVTEVAEILMEAIADDIDGGVLDDLIAPSGRPVLSDETIDRLFADLIESERDNGVRVESLASLYDSQIDYAEAWIAKQDANHPALADAIASVPVDRRIAAELRAWEAYATKRKAGR